MSAAQPNTSNTSKRKKLTEAEILALNFVDTKCCQEALSRMDSAMLVSRLKEIVTQYSGMTDTLYPEIRAEYCALHIELNNRYVSNSSGAMAMSFRPVLRHKHSVPGYEELLSNDTQVLDLHLLYLKGARPDTNRFLISAVKGDSFDFDSAYRFAVVGGDKKLKVDKLLSISINMQWEMLTLIEKPIRKKQDEIKSIRKKIINHLLGDWINRRYIKGNEEEWADIVVSELFAKWVNNIEKVYPACLAESFRIITGRADLTPQVIMRKLRRAKKYIPETIIR